MKTLLLILLVAFSLVQLSFSEVEEYYKPKTPELKKELIEGVKTKGRWFILYYREFETDSEKAILVLDEVFAKRDSQGLDFGLLRADCREDKEGLCEGVSQVSIPVLAFYHNGQGYVYKGDWNAEDIIRYAREGHYEGGDKFVEPSADSQLTLTSKNFDKETANGEWLIQVYAPWCRYCKELTPIWEELEERLNGQTVKLAKIDGTIESGLADRLEVRGFPTIYHVKGGQKREFPGTSKRDLASLLAFALASHLDVSPKPILKGQAEEEEVDSDLPSLVVTLSDNDFFEKTSEGVWLVEFYAPWCGHCKKLVPTWERLAQKAAGKFNVAKVDATENEGLAKAFGIRGFPTIKLLKDGQQYKFSGQRTTDAFLEFVQSQYQDTEPSPIPKSLEDYHQEL